MYPYITLLCFVSLFISSFSQPTVVIKGWAFDINSNLRTDDILPALRNLVDKNVTDVIATDNAFAIRVALNLEEATEAQTRFAEKTYHDAHGHAIANGNQPASIYVVYGDPTHGGYVPSTIIDFLKSAAGSSWPDEEIPTSGQTVGHVIFANDLCPMKDAFIALMNGKLACWGNEDTCTGWDLIFGDRKTLAVTQVLCNINGYAAVPVLNGGHPDYAAWISILGKPRNGGEFPTTPGFIDALVSMGDSVPLQFVGNAFAVAMLLQGGTVLAWGDPAKGGFIPPSIEAVFIKKLYANHIAFAALKQTLQIISWGDFPQGYIPERIRDGVGTERVLDVITGKECFLAVLEGGSVATWGKGDQLFCNEQGGGGSATYNPFTGVRPLLQSGVVKAVVNDWAFAVVKSDSSVVVWGHVANGGSKNPSNTVIYWDPSDIRDAKPESLTSTCCAFGFIRKDGRVVTWGAEEYGGRVDRQYATLGILKLVASNDTMASIDQREGLARWMGRTEGYFSTNSDYEDFRLVYPPKHLFRTTGGLATLLGKTCEFGDWSNWSACNFECGGGVQIRVRAVTSYPINDDCEYNIREERACNTEPCATELEKAKISDVSTVAWISIASGGCLVGGLIGYGVYAFIIKRESRDQYITLAGIEPKEKQQELMRSIFNDIEEIEALDLDFGRWRGYMCCFSSLCSANAASDTSEWMMTGSPSGVCIGGMLCV